LQIQPVKPAPAGERRVALVIGNSAYKTSPLRNPVNDARAISKALAATGFKVTVIEDATLTTMRRAVRAFGDELVAGGVGLFYYAGHGMQVRGRNFLIPVNADIEREDEVEDGALDANFVLSKMDSAKNALNLIILDACRNNPFARSFRSGSQGLAQMDAPSGTLVAFATAPGSVASDGEGDNGLYTKHLLANIGKPGLPIEQVFKEVRRGVGRETSDRQIPWESSSLRGDFFFIAPDPTLSAGAQKEQMERAIAEAVKREQDKLSVDRAAQQAQMQKMIQEMLAKQRAEMEEEQRRQRGEAPKPAPVAVAPAAASAIDRDALFWDSIKTSANPEDYRAYLAQFPRGTFAALARARASVPATSHAARPIEQLKPVAAVAQPPSTSAGLQAASAAPASMVGIGIEDPRYPRIGDRWEYRYTDFSSKQKRNVAYEVTAVSKEGILESADTGARGLVRRAYAAEPRLSYELIWDFAPYFLALSAAKEGQSWSALVPQRSNPWCVRLEGSCQISGRVVGREKVAVPAGSFDALKVVIDVSFLWRGPQMLASNAHVELVYWYADEIKRVVKTTSRTRGNMPTPDYDFELMRYAPAEVRDPNKPVQVASVAPTLGGAAQNPAFPKVGDRWEYSYLDVFTQRKRRAQIEIATVLDGALLENFLVENGETARRRHEKGQSLTYNDLWLEFSPYMLALDPPEGNAAWEALPIANFPTCMRSAFVCRAKGRAVGRERVRTPAGEFEALKVVVEMEVLPTVAAGGSVNFTHRVINFWYSDAVKRLVRVTSRARGNTADADYDVELVSYKLN
jgi:uncharacterized caspase-like protein